MRERNHKSFICCLLAGIGILLSVITVVGCSDNPETKAAKEVRQQTAEAVNVSVKDKNYADAQEKIAATLQQHRPSGLTLDAALLAGGNLALANGKQMQADMVVQVLPVNESMDLLEQTLRRAEELLIEKEHIERLLDAGNQEIAELQQVLSGDNGLEKQLEQANTRMTQLQTQAEAVQADRKKAQTVLDDYQTQADGLLRRAELAKGDEKLSLEKQAYAILEKRKDYYIQAQEAENTLENLAGELLLVQVRVDGAGQSIQEIRQRMAAIESSENRLALKQQRDTVVGDIGGSRQNLTRMIDDIKTQLKTCQETADKISAVFEAAAGEFEKISSQDASFAATLRLAESRHRAAQTGAAAAKIQTDTAGRFRDLMEATDPNVNSPLQGGLSIQSTVQADRKEKIIGLFDRAIEAYENAFAAAGPFGQDAECSVLKSQLLTFHDKRRFAGLCGDVELANATDSKMQELIKKGTEKGVCFTQSEAYKMIESGGLDYLPSLPLNMEVFVEGKKQELSAWKRLPLAQQEAAVDESLRQINELVAQYGQQITPELEPLKQEMLAAKERGFSEPAPGAAPGEPNAIN